MTASKPKPKVAPVKKKKKPLAQSNSPFWVQMNCSNRTATRRVAKRRN